MNWENQKKTLSLYYNIRFISEEWLYMFISVHLLKTSSCKEKNILDHSRTNNKSN